jgi:general secretion pathway protein M
MINEWIEHARGHLAGRSARERRVLAAGGIVLLILVGWGLVYQPMEQSRAKLVQRLPKLRAELRLMRVQAAEIERLRTHPGDTAGGTLEQRIKASAAAFGMAEGFTRFTPLTEDQVELATRPLPTGTWIDWLADLGRRGITVARCRISGGEQGGLASLELTLSGGRR